MVLQILNIPSLRRRVNCSYLTSLHARHILLALREFGISSIVIFSAILPQSRDKPAVSNGRNLSHGWDSVPEHW